MVGGGEGGQAVEGDLLGVVVQAVTGRQGPLLPPLGPEQEVWRPLAPMRGIVEAPLDPMWSMHVGMRPLAPLEPLVVTRWPLGVVVRPLVVGRWSLTEFLEILDLLDPKEKPLLVPQPVEPDILEVLDGDIEEIIHLPVPLE